MASGTARFRNSRSCRWELDEIAEGSHESLPLAILIALLQALRDPAGRECGVTGVLQVNPLAGHAMCCDNFA